MIRDTKLNMRKSGGLNVFQPYIESGRFNHLVSSNQEKIKLSKNLNMLEKDFHEIIDTIEAILNNRISKMSVYNKKFVAIADVTFHKEGSYAAIQSKDEKQARRGLRFKHKHDTSNNSFVFEYPVNIDHKIINPFLLIWLDGDVTKFEALHKYTSFQDTTSYEEAGGTSNMFMSVLAHELTHVVNLHVYSPTYVEKILTDDTYIPQEVIDNKEKSKSALNVSLENKISANEFLQLRAKKTGTFKRYHMDDEYVRSIAEIEAGLSMLWFGLFYGIIQIWSYFQLQSFILRNSYEYVTNSIKNYIKSEEAFDANKFVQKFMINNYIKIQEQGHIDNLLRLVKNNIGRAQSIEGILIHIQQEIMNGSPKHYGLDFGWYSMIANLLNRMNNFILLTITEYLAYVGRSIAKKIAQALDDKNLREQLISCLDLERYQEIEHDSEPDEVKAEKNQYVNEELVKRIVNTAILEGLEEILYRVSKDVSSYVSYVKHYLGKLIFNTSTMLITLVAIAKIVNAAFILSKYNELLESIGDKEIENKRNHLLTEFMNEIADVSRYAQLYYNGAKFKAYIPFTKKEHEYRVLSEDNFIADVMDYLIKIADYFRNEEIKPADINEIIINLKACIGSGLDFSRVKTIGDMLDGAFIYGHELINSYIKTEEAKGGQNPQNVQAVHINPRTRFRWGIDPSVALVTSSFCFNELKDLLLEFRVDDTTNVKGAKIIQISGNIKNENVRENIRIAAGERITINAFDEFNKYIAKTSNQSDTYLIKWLGTKTATMAAMQVAAVKAIFELFSTFQSEVNKFRDKIKSEIKNKSLGLSEFTKSLISDISDFIEKTWKPMIQNLNNSDNDNAITVPQNIHFRKKIHGLLGYAKERQKHPRVTLLYESLLGPCSVSDFGVLTAELHYDYVICYGVHGKLMYLPPDLYEIFAERQRKSRR